MLKQSDFFPHILKTVLTNEKLLIYCKLFGGEIVQANISCAQTSKRKGHLFQGGNRRPSKR